MAAAAQHPDIGFSDWFQAVESFVPNKQPVVYKSGRGRGEGGVHSCCAWS